jgi:hypothetical protein
MLLDENFLSTRESIYGNTISYLSFSLLLGNTMEESGRRGLSSSLSQMSLESLLSSKETYKGSIDSLVSLLTFDLCDVLCALCRRPIATVDCSQSNKFSISSNSLSLSLGLIV